MTVQQMRNALKGAYSGPDWPYKVDKMSDNQVIAIYKKLNSEGKFN